MSAITNRDRWDDIPDEELEETLYERIEGLGEMFPVTLRKAFFGSIDWSVWGVKTSFWLARNGVWIAATSALIMFMPYIIEKERSDLQKSQVAQQRQMLLGPAAAVQAAKPSQ